LRQVGCIAMTDDNLTYDEREALKQYEDIIDDMQGRAREPTPQQATERAALDAEAAYYSELLGIRLAPIPDVELSAAAIADELLFDDAGLPIWLCINGILVERARASHLTAPRYVDSPRYTFESRPVGYEVLRRKAG
jgi:hypothetical protein